ncbi:MULTISPECIES: hypothetical protein [unclassified Providencia]|uniref:hypothetical protein n=1 Tax=unclassified Providencia TaxID=2633465 RepID=UPI00234B680D|nr:MULTISPECIES: hypothetical protein [unclassified Providencia]
MKKILDKPVGIFTIIYFVTVIAYALLRYFKVSESQAFSANIIGLLVFFFMWMLIFLNEEDKNKKNDKNSNMMKQLILTLQLMCFSIAIIITPSFF